jgi:hypothetical protein
MTDKLDIESRLDRSLQRQVRAPRLDERFDAGVWARIAAEGQSATQSVTRVAKVSESARWMFITNVVGLSIAALLVVVFGLRAFGGVEVSVPVPQIAPATIQEIVSLSAKALTVVALLFGLMFTPIGRRLRAELS